MIEGDLYPTYIPTFFGASSLCVVVEQLGHIPHIQKFKDGKCLALDQKSIVIGRNHDNWSTLCAQVLLHAK